MSKSITDYMYLQKGGRFLYTFRLPGTWEDNFTFYSPPFPSVSDSTGGTGGEQRSQARRCLKQDSGPGQGGSFRVSSSFPCSVDST